MNGENNNHSNGHGETNGNVNGDDDPMQTNGLVNADENGRRASSDAEDKGKLDENNKENSKSR